MVELTPAKPAAILQPQAQRFTVKDRKRAIDAEPDRKGLMDGHPLDIQPKNLPQRIFALNFLGCLVHVIPLHYFKLNII
jgi:hypothetical protein